MTIIGKVGFSKKYSILQVQCKASFLPNFVTCCEWKSGNTGIEACSLKFFYRIKCRSIKSQSCPAQHPPCVFYPILSCQYYPLFNSQNILSVSSGLWCHKKLSAFMLMSFLLVKFLPFSQAAFHKDLVVDKISCINWLNSQLLHQRIIFWICF